MATNDKKQEARQKREAAQLALQAKAKRNQQLQILAGVIFAALVVVVLVVVIGGASNDDGTGDADSAAKGDLAGVTETKELLDGVPQNGLTIGEKDAPVQIVEFIDLQCEFCKAHQLDEQPKLINELVKSGEAKLTFAPIAFLGPDSEDGRVVLARLAGKDLAWNFANLWYWNQGDEGTGYATDAYIKGLLAAIPGTTSADASREPDEEITKRLDEVDRWQDELGVNGTPTFFVGKTGGDVTKFARVDAGANVSDQIIEKVREIAGEDQ